MSSLRVEQHIKKISEARQLLMDSMEHIEDRGDETLYADGAQWTIRQLLIHLVIADRGHNAMVMNIAEGRDIIPEDYDLERFNKRSVEKQAEMSISQAQQALISSREELLAWLPGISDEHLDRQGRHASMRILSVSQILDVMAWHEKTHTQDILAHLGKSGQS